MCIFDSVLGSGPELQIQILTLITIACSICLWVWIYRREGVGLRQYAIPIILWVAFGSLDITITAKGTFEDPLREGNPLARFIFLNSGFVGPIVASFLWIALWSGIVLLINKRFGKRQEIVAFVSLAVFYSVAIGHLFGFSSWYAPLCPVASIAGGWRNFAGIVFLGICAAGAHLGAKAFWDKFI
jgi:hypothetical protein